MKFTKTKIEGVMIIEPDLYGDDRGYFFESYHKEKFFDAGINVNFVQDNQSSSKQGTLRGLHFQAIPKAQAKLVRVLEGEIFDVGVDLRKGSVTYGKWVGEFLSENNKKMLYIPQNFAHGFYVLSDSAVVSYKCSDVYDKESERSILWNDQTINIKWPILDNVELCISEKDKTAARFETHPLNPPLFSKERGI
jgi:dTDP-4-dehydrorhamnose 3,5-epimerase